DDILLCTAGLLAEDADVAGEVRRTYRHFVVDEYQDVSPLQQALLDLWRGDSDEICVVGDPAQTIHSFAGAQATFLTGFTTRHPNATVVELVRDYRSTPQVVALANAVMKGHGPGVELRAQRPPGPEPVFAAAPSESAEAAGVAAWLAERHRGGTPWSEMAVLYRIHAQSPAVESALAEAGIPFATRGSEGFFDRSEVRAALRALAAAAKATPQEAPDGVLRAALTGLGFTSEPPSGQGTARERWESWSALAALGDEFARTHPEADTAGLLAELEHRARAQHAPTGQGVTLSTLHAAKGLEWDAVAIIGVHEGGLPFVLATGPEAVAEERRLFYVGITRAREHLRLSWSVTRNGGGQRRSPSRFLDGTVAPRTPAPAPSGGRRARRGSALSATCRACGRGLTSGAERKLKRHTTCPSTYDEATWEALRAWRKARAEEASMPAFVIFTDATLMAIAEQRPANLSDLAAISGVGRTKLERYGTGVLAVLDQHR
ncbi:MAG: ATP-dependent DNA helicase UvrD2, partial [Propionibacteriaceae bacterium]|nr:ATP-dependent DNA helicase UvrD2 [Propionibacteriaceae bacterium]